MEAIFVIMFIFFFINYSGGTQQGTGGQVQYIPVCDCTKSQNMEQNEINYEDHRFGYKYDFDKTK